MKMSHNLALQKQLQKYNRVSSLLVSVEADAN